MAATGEARNGAARAGALGGPEAAEGWAARALGVILAVTALKLALNAFGWLPAHFDEAQYWSYGEALDFGYYSKPPMVAWLIRLSTEIFGDTLFGLRFFAPLLHAGIAWTIFACGRLLFEGRTGFWAALLYLAAPGVTVSSAVISTDPPMMLAWSLALYALIQAMIAEGPEGRRAQAPAWWLAFGAAIGLGLLSKYTIVVLPLGALGYALFSSQEGPIWRRRFGLSRLGGPALALLAAIVVWSPNLIWNAAHDFSSIAHVGENAKLEGGPRFNPGNMGEFLGAQLGVFGPLAFLALPAFVALGRWRHEWPFRLLLWLSLPLILAMSVQALISRAHPNWAAPAYVAGAILVAAWALDLGRRWILTLSLAIGALAAIGFHGALALYDARGPELPRAYDPAKKTRHYAGACARALALRGELRLISSDRKLLADCLFAGKLGLDQIRMTPVPSPGNHYELVASLDPNGAAAREETFLFVFRAPPDLARVVLNRFEQVEIVETGETRTHADHVEPYLIARVRGYRG